MKLKFIVGTTLLLSLTAFSGAQLFASNLTNDPIKTNVVYAVSDTTSAAVNELATKEMYSDLAYKVLEDYFGVSKDSLPKDSKFQVTILSNDFVNEEEQKWLNDCKAQLDQNKISQDEYEKQVAGIKAEHNNARAQIKRANHDIVQCELFTVPGPNGIYDININPNTKEAYFAAIPMTDEGWKVQTQAVGKPGEATTPLTVSSATIDLRKDFCTEYIKKHQLAGIENPEFVSVYGATKNRLIYKDAKDDTKYAAISFDPSTDTKIVSIMTDAADIKEIFLK